MSTLLRNLTRVQVEVASKLRAAIPLRVVTGDALLAQVIGMCSEGHSRTVDTEVPVRAKISAIKCDDDADINIF